MHDWFADPGPGPDVPRLRVSLRIQGDELDPEFLTQHLGIAPAYSAAKGDPDENGGRDAPRDSGIWVHRIEVPEGTELGDAVDMLLASLPDSTVLWEELVSSYSVDVFCGVFLQGDNQSTRIAPEVLAALGRRGFGVTFDLYAPFESSADVTADDEA